jgi:hypothetical protein
MHAELESYLDQLLSITQDAPGIAANLTDAQFNWRPAPGRWSMAECFDHLNRTAHAYMGRLDASIAEGRSRGLTAPGPFVHSLLDRLILRSMEPPVRFRMRSPRVFRPAPERAHAETMREFQEWQERFADRLRAADGLDLRRIRSRSPAVTRLTYSLGTAFAIFLAHERRHLWQARGIRNDRAFPRSR